MRVDQAGRDVRAMELKLFAPAIVEADAGDALAADGDVGGLDVAAEDVDDAGVFEHEIGGCVAAGDRDELRQGHCVAILSQGGYSRALCSWRETYVIARYHG